MLRPPRRHARRVAVFLSVALVAGILPFVLPAASTSATADPAVPEDSDHAADESTARLIAAAHDHDVVVDDLSSSTYLVTARPDGSMQSVSSQVPEQAHVKGTWTKIDTALVEKAEWFEPAVAAVPVRIGKGGDDNIVSIRAESGDWVKEAWPYGALPTPTVKKSAAVFAEVFPGVDLRVTATKAGMREVLVVKNEKAAQDDRLGALRIAIRGAKLVEPDADGTLEAHTSSGEPLVASTPVWWDSSAEAATPESPGGAETQPLERSVDGEHAVLDIGAVVDEGVTYPLYVDPDFNSNLQAYWYTDRAYPNERYLNRPETKVGNGVENGVSYLSRSYHRFNMAPLAGKLIQSAQFSITQTWSNSCDANPVQLWQAGDVGDGFSWNDDPSQRGMLLDQQVSRKGSSCEAPGAVGFTATALVQQAAALGNGSAVFALGSAAGDNGNQYTRKHYDWASRLIVTYNSRPNTPANPAMIAPSRACSTDTSNPSYVYGGAPITVKVNVSDEDGQNTAASIYVKRISTGEQTTYNTPLQAQGADLTRTLPANSLVDGEKYAWSAQGSDWIQTSAANSPWCYFVVDSTKPALPTVQVDQDGARVGSPVTVRVTPPAGEKIAGYQVWWTEGAATEPSPPAPVTDYVTALPPCDSFNGPARVVCADPSGAAVFQAAPPETLATLWVAAYDRAGNVSYAPATTSSASGVTVRAAAPDLSRGHAWMPFDASGTTVDDSVGSVPLKVGTFSGWNDSGSEDPQLTFPALASLNRYNTGAHWAETDPAKVPGGAALERTLGQILRPQQTQPANTRPLYACARGAGNMPSTYASCEGTNATARLLGYTANTAADVPAGMTATEVFRCRVGVDYFLADQRSCEGQLFEGSLGFVGAYVQTATAERVVDTSKSFSVSARVKPASTSGIQTVAATTSATDSAFYLRTSGDAWQFCLRTQGANSRVTRCVDGPKVNTDRFVTVTGTWDVVNQRISLAVLDGSSLSRTYAYATLATAEMVSTGVVVVGSARLSGAVTYQFEGSVADLAVYPTVLPAKSLIANPIPLP